MVSSVSSSVKQEFKVEQDEKENVTRAAAWQAATHITRYIDPEDYSSLKEYKLSLLRDMPAECSNSQFSIAITSANQSTQVNSISSLAHNLFLDVHEVESAQKSNTLQKLIDQRMALFQQYANIFKLYKQNELGMVVSKKTGFKIGTFINFVQSVIGIFYYHVTAKRSDRIFTNSVTFKFPGYQFSVLGKVIDEKVKILLHDQHIITGRVTSTGCRAFNLVEDTYEFFREQVVRKKSSDAATLATYRIVQTAQKICRYHALCDTNGAVPHPGLPSRPTLFLDTSPDGVIGISEKFFNQRSVLTFINSTRPTFKTVLGFMLDTAKALAEMHRHCIWHKEVKPTNILLHQNDEGEFNCVLSDWDKASFLGLTDNPTDNIEHHSKPYFPFAEYREAAYIAKYEKDKKVLKNLLFSIGSKQDIFALGVCFYQFLNQAKKPYENFFLDKNRSFRILLEQLFSLQKTCPSRDLGMMILKMISIDPALRPTIDVVCATLAKTLADVDNLPNRTGPSIVLADTLKRSPAMTDELAKMATENLASSGTNPN